MEDIMKTAKRIFLYILGFFVMAIGINISKNAGLGISPVSSVPYSMELVWGIEMGIGTYIANIGIMLVQFLILRKNYKAKHLLEIVPLLFIGAFITITSKKYLLFWLPAPATYIVQLIYCLTSIVLIGIGVSMFIVAGFMPLPPEGLAKTITELGNGKIKFGNAKIGVDVTLVTISAIISVVFLGKLVSVREGTVLAAILVGKVVNVIFKHYRQRMLDWFEKGESLEKPAIAK
jgi:uncharacterized membrane protein YczE